MKRSIIIVLFCTIILALCSALSINRGEVAAKIDTRNITLPWICLFKTITGIDCPVCGLTRSMISVGHLDFDKAWRYNRAGILVYLFVIYQFSCHIFLAIKARDPKLRNWLKGFAVKYVYAIEAALVMGWLFRFVYR
jgi:hypothetical protein